MILSVSHIYKSFHEVPILQDISFHIEDYDKAAIVGINGAGKTTLIKVILGQLEADQGLVTVSKDKTIGYLAQQETVDSSNTVWQELEGTKAHILTMEQKIRSMEQQMPTLSGEALEHLMAEYAKVTDAFEQADGYAYRSEVTGVLKGLGFAENDFDKSVSTLSGGEKTRVALGKLLLIKPDLIILDEPTNHLDLNSIKWLETYLLNYKGAVLLVSHDRYFLDRITNKIIELDQTKGTVFTGNYSDYAGKKEILRTMQMNAYLNQQRDIQHQEQVIEKLKSFNREKSIKRAESREKMLDKVERIDKPTELNSKMNLHLEPYIVSGNDVMSIQHLTKSYGDRVLFSDQNIELKRGEHVAIIGDNGTGKTTILKIINELEQADSGTITLGSNVHIGYYDQEHHELHPEKTLFEEISDDYPYLNNTQIRTTLAAFLFTGDDVFKKISSLSGGEQGRVSLAKLMLSESNYLILDEPTNHLDIQSKEILENALNQYTGTVLYVSHDRYFINKTAHRILELDQGQFVGYLGNYDYYSEKKQEKLLQEPASGVKSSIGKATAGQTSATGYAAALTGIKTNVSTTGKPSDSNASATAAETISESGAQDWKAQKQQQAAKRKLENELKKCEDRIAQLESQIEDLEAQMQKTEIATNSVKIQEVTKKHGECEEELAGLYEKWEELSEML